MGAYDFIVDLHSKGGVVVNQYICRGGSHIEYKESGREEVKEIFLNKA